ncbi:MAG: hypothetical protein PHQ62_01900 [Clostridia bacterium]|nr:hypothetical protein [Clostridia bacterium]
MWEFSITMDSEKSKIAKYIYAKLKPSVEEIKGVITSFEEMGKINIVLACKKLEKTRLCYHVSEVICYVVSTVLKEEFLDKNLKFPQKDKLELYTFKKALVSFDRETDRFLINKYLVLEENLILESFFHFKLQPLKEKWQELVKIANDNSTYLLSDDSFLELLKFLIDNIEFASDELNVVFQQEKFFVFDSNFKQIGDENSVFDEFALVNKILELSPRKINWACDKKIPFIEKVFSKRLLFISENEFAKKDINNNWGLQTT